MFTSTIGVNARRRSGSPTTDPDWASVWMLCHMDAAVGSNLVLAAGSGLQLYGSGAALTGSPTNVKFGADAASIPGTSGTGISTSGAVNPGHWAASFCIEFWIKLNNVSGSKRLYNQYDSGGPASVNFAVFNDTVTIDYSFNGSSWNSTGTGSVLTSGVYHHIALTREMPSGVFRIFVDGIKGAETSADASTLHNGGAPLYLGNYYGGDGPLNGYIDDFRFTVGVPRYTANFTPPTAAFPDS